MHFALCVKKMLKVLSPIAVKHLKKTVSARFTLALFFSQKIYGYFNYF